jgi:hypothetical protein
VIFIIIDKYEINDPKFMTNEDYRKPYKMFSLMNSAELEDVLKDIDTYHNIDKRNKVF